MDCEATSVYPFNHNIRRITNEYIYKISIFLSEWLLIATMYSHRVSLSESSRGAVHSAPLLSSSLPASLLLKASSGQSTENFSTSQNQPYSSSVNLERRTARSRVECPKAKASGRDFGSKNDTSIKVAALLYYAERVLPLDYR